MVESGKWAVPHLNGEAFITKPPLYYWSVACVFRLRDKFDEFGARLPSVVAGSAGVLLVYFWASLLSSPRTGLIAGIILASNFLYVGMARSAEADMMLTLFTTAALYCFSAGYLQQNGPGRLSRDKGTAMYTLATICLALGTLTKYPIGLAVPLIAIILFIFVTRHFRLFLDTKPWWMTLLFLAIVLPWFLIVSHRVPDFFEILEQETLKRYTHPMETPHLEPVYFYFQALGSFMPWVIFLPGLITGFFNADKRSQIPKSQILVYCAFIGGFLLFSSVGSKREYYLLPLYPFLAIITAQYWDDYLKRSPSRQHAFIRKGIEIPLLMTAGILCLLGLALPIVALLVLPNNTALSLFVALLLLSCGVLLFNTVFTQQSLQSFIIFVVATVLLYLYAQVAVVPEIDRYRSRKVFLQDAAAIAGRHLVIDYRYESYQLPFYMQRIVPVVTSVSGLREIAARERFFYTILQAGPYEELRQDAPDLLAKSEIVLEGRWQSAIHPERSRRLILLKYERQQAQASSPTDE